MEKERRVPKRRFREFAEAGEWSATKLGDVATFTKGIGYSKDDLVTKGTPVILYGRMYTDYETVIDAVDTYVEPLHGSFYSTGREVIVPASGETAEDISIASAVRQPDVLLGGDLNVISPDDAYDPTFLAIFLSHGKAKQELSRKAQGKTIVHLHGEDLRDVDVLAPTLKEQQQIGAFCCKIDNLITSHERKLQKLAHLKQAYLAEMFPAKGERQPRRRFMGFSGDWEEKSLWQLCSEFRSGDFLPANEIMEKGRYPVYGGNGLRGFAATFNHEGDYALIGRQGALCGNMNFSTGKAYFTEHAIAVKGNETANTRFLYYLCGIMELGQYSGQSAQPGLAVNKLKEVPALVPSINEQQIIGKFLHQIDLIFVRQESKLAKLRALKQAYLSELFV